MSDKFLGIGRGSNSLGDGTATLNINALTISGLETSQIVKTNSVRQLVSGQVDISDVAGLQSALNSLITNPMNANLDMATNSINNVDTLNCGNVASTNFVRTSKLGSLTAGTSIKLHETIEPAVSTVDLGTASNEILNIYSSTVHTENLNSALGTLTLITDIEPNITNVRSLGTSSKLFSSVYTTNVACNVIQSNTGNLIINDTIEPAINLGLNLGTGAKRYDNAYIQNIYTENIISDNGLSIRLYTDLFPDVNNTRDLGANALGFSNAYIDKVYTQQLISINGVDIDLLNHLIPNITSVRDLGTNALTFGNAYIDKVYTNDLQSIIGFITSSSSIKPAASGLDLGNSTIPWGTGYINSLYVDELRTIAGSIQLDNEIIPNVDMTHDLGSSTKAFKDIYTNRILTNELQAVSGGITLNNSITPASANTRNLGSQTFYFNDVFTDKIIINTIDGLGSTNVNLECNLIPDITSTRTLGTSTKEFSEIYADTLNVTYLKATGDMLFQTSGTTTRGLRIKLAQFESNLDNNMYLGSAAKRWISVWSVDGSINTSSRTQKKNIMPCKMGLEFVSALEPVMYLYNEDEDDAPMRCGLIYEDVKKVVKENNYTFRGLHENVDEETGEIGYGINYESLIAPLIASVKELKAEVETLKQQIKNIST